MDNYGQEMHPMIGNATNVIKKNGIILKMIHVTFVKLVELISNIYFLKNKNFIFEYIIF